MAAEQRLPEPEGGEAGGKGGHEDHRREDAQLGPQDGQPTRHDRKRGPDHAGAVLTAYREDPEYPEGDDGEGRAGQAYRDRVEGSPVRGAERLVLAPPPPRERGAP